MHDLVPVIIDKDRGIAIPCTGQGSGIPNMRFNLPTGFTAVKESEDMTTAIVMVSSVETHLESLKPSRTLHSTGSCGEHSAPYAQLCKDATLPSSSMSACPMDVDTNPKDVSFASSCLVSKDESISSGFKPYLAESMYRFSNRQSQDSYINIPHSLYQTLLDGKTSTYSSHNRFSTLTIRIKKPHKVTTGLTTGMSAPNFQRQTDCHLAPSTIVPPFSTPTPVEDCMMQDSVNNITSSDTLLPPVLTESQRSDYSVVISQHNTNQITLFGPDHFH